MVMNPMLQSVKDHLISSLNLKYILAPENGWFVPAKGRFLIFQDPPTHRPTLVPVMIILTHPSLCTLEASCHMPGPEEATHLKSQPEVDIGNVPNSGKQKHSWLENPHLE